MSSTTMPRFSSAKVASLHEKAPKDFYRQLHEQQSTLCKGSGTNNTPLNYSSGVEYLKRTTSPRTTRNAEQSPQRVRPSTASRSLDMALESTLAPVTHDPLCDPVRQWDQPAVATPWTLKKIHLGADEQPPADDSPTSKQVHVSPMSENERRELAEHLAAVSRILHNASVASDRNAVKAQLKENTRLATLVHDVASYDV